MGIVTGITKVVEIPGDPGQSVTIKMLSYLELKASSDARLPEIAKNTQLLAGLKDLLAQAESIQRAEDPESLGSYDITTLLKAGVTAWSYPGEVDTAQFDEATATLVAREILRLSKPRAADLGKASSPSTGT